ncbi:hypothetical protein [Rhodococcus sp. JT-3]|uniref:hypothetical protein n=1 Tax=Rhodococcus sp. JT-3 TaxID=1973213 RepID=UPI0018EED526|nr:hypothetical protein [Rhodococcus sp. JT-3]
MDDTDQNDRGAGPSLTNEDPFIAREIRLDQFDLATDELEFDNLYLAFKAAHIPVMGRGSVYAARAAHKVVENASESVTDLVRDLRLHEADWIGQPKVEDMRLQLLEQTLLQNETGAVLKIQEHGELRGEISISEAEGAVAYVKASKYLTEIDAATGNSELGPIRTQMIEGTIPPAIEELVEDANNSVADLLHDGTVDSRSVSAALAYTLPPRELAARVSDYEARTSEQTVGLDKTAGHEVPVDSGVRVDPIAAGAARPGAQSVPQPDQRVHDIASWLYNANLRARAGEAVKPPKPIKEVLGHFKSAPIDQTRIQILAAAAAARTLEGEQSANAQRLNKLVVETQTRLNAIRDHERRTVALEHREKETPREKIAEWDQNRIDRESANDRNVFNAAAAVAAGYVAARGLPAHDQLAQLADEQLGPVPEAPAPAPDKTPQPEKQSGPSKAGQIKNVLDSAGRGLAQAVGPVAGDDEVAPNLSPINLTQVTEELAQLAASIAPAMKAAMGSHPRSVKELLNIVQTPDEESDLAFEQNTGLGVERERETEHSV